MVWHVRASHELGLISAGVTGTVPHDTWHLCQVHSTAGIPMGGGLERQTATLHKLLPQIRALLFQGDPPRHQHSGPRTLIGYVRSATVPGETPRQGPKCRTQCITGKEKQGLSVS